MCDASDFAVEAVLGQKDADHLSRIENDESSNDSEVDDNFPGETIMEINTKDEPWFAQFANYLVGDIIPKGMTYQQKNKFFSDLKHYFWEEPYLFKISLDSMIRRCISGPETRTILDQCHHRPTSGHYGPNVTAKKVLDAGFYWPTIIKEAHTLVRLCEACQKTRNISKRDEMPLNNIQVRSRGSDFDIPVVFSLVIALLRNKVRIFLIPTPLTIIMIYALLRSFRYWYRYSDLIVKIVQMVTTRRNSDDDVPNFEAMITAAMANALPNLTAALRTQITNDIRNGAGASGGGGGDAIPLGIHVWISYIIN
ncbi:reverse transcriptase domain-containing protein [Tanacetum coccineum]